MKSILRTKSTVLALAIGIIVGMLVPITLTRAQGQGVVQTPFGALQRPSVNPNDCEQYYRNAMGNQSAPEAASLQALLYLACKEHSR